MSEPKFIPAPGQVDYTNIRYCPVINCVLRYENKILLVKRSSVLKLYPGYWNGISGFLDSELSVEDKALEELREELNINNHDVLSIKRGRVLVQESEKYLKTWIVFPLLVDVKTTDIKLDWEASSYKWLTVRYAKKLNLLPGFKEVIDELL